FAAGEEGCERLPRRLGDAGGSEGAHEGGAGEAMGGDAEAVGEEVAHGALDGRVEGGATAGGAGLAEPPFRLGMRAEGEGLGRAVRAAVGVSAEGDEAEEG